MHLGKRWKVAQVCGSLTLQGRKPEWPPGFGLTQPCMLQSFGKWSSRWKMCLSRGQHCGMAGKPTTKGVGITYGHWFKSQLLHFKSNSKLTSAWESTKWPRYMDSVLGWEPQMKLLAPGLSAQPSCHFGHEHCLWMEDFCFCISLSLSNSAFEINTSWKKSLSVPFSLPSLHHSFSPFQFYVTLPFKQINLKSCPQPRIYGRYSVYILNALIHELFMNSWF